MAACTVAVIMKARGHLIAMKSNMADRFLAPDGEGSLTLPLQATCGENVTTVGCTYANDIGSEPITSAIGT